MANNDIRIDTVNAPFPEEGRFSHFIISRKIDVPALITAGTLTASGLVSGDYYYLFNLPKYSIVLGGFLFVRQVEATAPTGTITIYDSGGTTHGSAIVLTSLGIAVEAAGAGWTIANMTKFNTGAGTDYIKMLINTASPLTAIFDVCVEVLKGSMPYNAGSLAGSTGQ